MIAALLLSAAMAGELEETQARWAAAPADPEARAALVEAALSGGRLDLVQAVITEWMAPIRRLTEYQDGVRRARAESLRDVDAAIGILRGLPDGDPLVSAVLEARWLARWPERAEQAERRGAEARALLREAEPSAITDTADLLLCIAEGDTADARGRSALARERWTEAMRAAERLAGRGGERPLGTARLAEVLVLRRLYSLQRDARADGADPDAILSDLGAAPLPGLFDWSSMSAFLTTDLGAQLDADRIADREDLLLGELADESSVRIDTHRERGRWVKPHFGGLSASLEAAVTQSAFGFASAETVSILEKAGSGRGFVGTFLVTEAEADLALGRSLHRLGLVADARPFLWSALDKAAERGNGWGLADAADAVARLSVRIGQPAAARLKLDPLRPRMAALKPRDRIRIELAVARLRLAEGSAPAAISAVRSAAARAAAFDPPLDGLVAEARLIEARALLRQGDLAGGSAILGEVIHPRLVAREVAGDVGLGLGGDDPEAVAHVLDQFMRRAIGTAAPDLAADPAAVRRLRDRMLQDEVVVDLVEASDRAERLLVARGRLVGLLEEEGLQDAAIRTADAVVTGATFDDVGALRDTSVDLVRLLVAAGRIDDARGVAAGLRSSGLAEAEWLVPTLEGRVAAAAGDAPAARARFSVALEAARRYLDRWGPADVEVRPAAVARLRQFLGPYARFLVDQGEASEALAVVERFEGSVFTAAFQRARSVRPPDATPADLAAALGAQPRETRLVYFYDAGDGLLRFTLDRAGRVEVASIDRAVVRRASVLADQLSDPASHVDRALQAEVGGALLGGLESAVFRGEGRILVVLPPSLDDLPLEALRLDGKEVIEGNPIVYAGSGGVFLQAARTREALPARPAVTTLVSPALPYGAKEVERIAKHAAAVQVLAPGSQKDAFAALATAGPVLHVGAHFAPFHGAPGLSALVFEGYEIPAIELRGRTLSHVSLAFVNACRSGEAGAVPTGDSLADAFLIAGVDQVVVTRWEVADGKPLVRLAGAFYEALAEGEAPPEALRKARLEARRRDAHPFHWAAHVLAGTP